MIGCVGVCVGYWFEGKSNNDIYLKVDLLCEFVGDCNVIIWGKDIVLVDN